MLNNGQLESFDTKCLFIFDPLESISDKSESEFCTLSEYELRNCVCRFLFESSELISGRPKKLVGTANKQVLLTPYKSLCKDAKLCRIQQLFPRETLFGQKSRFRKNENSEALSKDKKNSNSTFRRVDFALQAGITTNIPTFSFGSQK